MELDTAGYKGHNKEIGRFGESVAATFLMKQGFTLETTNYWQKWGEIDLVMKKDAILHFIEVKSVSYETIERLEAAVLHETWRPEENVHKKKLERLARTIETYLQEKKWLGSWQIDVVVARLVPRETYATIDLIENIII